MQWDLKVIHVGVYRHAQRMTQINDRLYVGFSLSGLRCHAIDGLPPVTRAPLLSLTPPGTETVFEYDGNRENWVVFVETPHVRRGERPGRVALQSGEDSWVEVPWYRSVALAEAGWWQSRFMELGEMLKSPTPRHRLQAALRVMQVLDLFLDAEEAESPAPAGIGQSPAQRLKRLIDHDPTGTRSLAQLSEQCGYSPDHLRGLFEARFGLTPGTYRQRRRLAEAMERISRSQMSVKQIAAQAGFPQTAHFSAAFRRAYGMTPTEAIRRFRLL